ncbi:hypothetical protein BGX27_004751 [Mortierella sp. AM989]|nr:hypothetical protein BGX27_004751 [Mortierella sp. AM989]
MKFNHPILLLSLSLSTAVSLLSDASPANTHSSASIISTRQQHAPNRFNTHSRKSRPKASVIDIPFDLPSTTPPLTESDIARPRRLKRRSSNGRSRLSGSSSSPPFLEAQGGHSKIEASGKNYLTHNRRRPTPRSLAQKKKAKSLVKRASTKYQPLSTEDSSTLPNSPLLLLPDSRSVWQTGSYQTVQWSRKYTKSLPKDTTVDIILVDSKTNRKISSLKRFIPFKKGSSQVWVPVNLPEGVSFVLVLELYRGRSQEQVTSTIASSPSQSTLYQAKDQVSPEKVSEKKSEQPSTSTDVLSTIVRRSDISISPGARKVARDSPYLGSSDGGALGTSRAGAHHDINNDDYYTGATEERPLEFLPEEMREEYPNTVRPLELEHTFGTHQKVYTMTPYTLEWKIPDRIKELLEYTRQVQLAASVLNKNNQRQQQNSSKTPKSIFLAKVLVELVTDQTEDSVTVLARDIPAETMFQYLSIQDRVPQAFYRLRVQMVVVQVNVDANTLNIGQMPPPITKSKGMEGWEFPNGGQVIDRYEAVTRRFWVSQGAL